MQSTTTKGETYDQPNTVTTAVKEYYGKTLQKTADLKTSACTSCKAPPPHVRAALKKLPPAVVEKFYGCGNPIPNGIDGLHILDLGSGSGRDCYVAALLAGPTGSVTGIDMTDEQLKVARDNIQTFRDANPNAAPMKFLTGYIERIGAAGVASESMDLVISNCVVNLSPDKPAVLRGVYDALKHGGEFHFSDVYVDRRLSIEARNHELLFGECIAGALYVGDFLSLCRRVGFNDPREVSRTQIEVLQPELRKVLGSATFWSITYRLFKGALEDRCEDYGQVAWYNGTIPESSQGYTLDDRHYFETGKPVLVCGNTASMLSETWLKAHFRVLGDRTVHFGLFPCRPDPSPVSSAAGSGCC
jgi:arsenite methyltransferase